MGEFVISIQPPGWIEVDIVISGAVHRARIQAVGTASSPTGPQPKQDEVIDISGDEYEPLKPITHLGLVRDDQLLINALPGDDALEWLSEEGKTAFLLPPGDSNVRLLYLSD